MKLSIIHILVHLDTGLSTIIGDGGSEPLSLREEEKAVLLSKEKHLYFRGGVYEMLSSVAMESDGKPVAHRTYLHKGEITK